MRKTMILPVVAGALLALGGCADNYPSGADAKKSPASQYQKIMKDKCTTCHSASVWEGKNYSAKQWDAVLEDMKRKGADITTDELQMLKHWAK